MENSDRENDSDVEIMDDDVQPEDLFNDEADEDGGDEKNEEPQEKSQKDSKEKEEKKIKKRKSVKNTRTTINYNTLNSNNGIGALKKLFKNFKFKGNGHEKEDLIKIMGILQQWMCYQLCPSYDFESCMLFLEYLGQKRNIQVLMSKFRLGMDEWGEVVPDNAVVNNIEGTENPEKNEFDLLLDEEFAKIRSDDEMSLNEEMVTVNENQHNTQIEPEVTLTPEQLERIARNKKLAKERRKQRMSQVSEVMDCSVAGDHEISLEKFNLDENS